MESLVTKAIGRPDWNLITPLMGTLVTQTNVTFVAKFIGIPRENLI